MPLELDHVTTFLSRLNIRDRDTGIMLPFKLRQQQAQVIEEAKEHLRRKRRLFMIFLKARRVGLSTLSTGLLTAHCIAHPASQAGTVAQNREVALANYQMACGFAEDLQPVYGRGAIKPTAKTLVYPHDEGRPSTFKHYTAATVHGSRGLTFSALHMTEAAFYPYDGAFTSLMNTLSKDPNNICIIETTANGMEGPGESYYEYWKAAEEGENEFLPIFLPWYDDPEYVRDPEMAKDAPRDEYERWLMNDIRDWRTGKKVKISKAQIAFFRDTLATKCEGIIEAWRAEYPSCLVGDTRVSTDRGIVRIDQAGEAQYTETGKVEKWGPQPVSPVFRLTTRRGRVIEGTFDHPVMTSEGEWEWLGRLTKGRSIKLSPPMFSGKWYTHTWHPAPGIDASVTIGSKWALLIGYFMGDGCWYKGAMDVCCDAKDQDVVREVGWLCDELFGYHSLKQIQRIRGRKGCTVVKTGGGGEGKMNPIAMLHAFRELGLLTTQENKGWDTRRVCVPECIWRSPKQQVAQFLSALFECDGCAAPDNIQFATVHKQFARDIQLLLLGFGINSSIAPTVKKAGNGKEYGGFKVRLNLFEALKFARDIGFRSARKSANRYRVPERNLFVYRESENLEDQVESVEYLRDDVTWDFTIADVHCFGANGILTHNTPDEAFVATGNPAFTVEEMQFASASVVKNAFVGRCVLSSDKKHGELQRDHEGPLEVYESPQEGHHYFAGVDSARGEEANVTAGDYAAIGVWNAETGATAARFMARVSPEELAETAAAIGYYFNGAMLNVELNNLGYVTMKELRDRLYYPSQYLWKGRDDRSDKSKAGMAYGFETSDRYRRMMFTLFRTALHRKEVIVKDRILVSQMRGAKLEMNFRWTVRVGHDDVLMAYFLGWIAKEQYHPDVCRVRPARNLLLPKDDTENLGLAGNAKMPEWTKDGFVTAMGGILQNGNDHLKALDRYNKQKSMPQRLQGV